MPADSSFPFVRNLMADAAMRGGGARPQRIDAFAYSTARGFTKTSLLQDETPGFDAALALLAGDSDVLSGLSPEAAMALWSAGLIVLPQEQAAPFAPTEFATPQDFYARHGFTTIDNCITPAMTAALTAHYRALVAAGEMKRGDSQADRYAAHNDPAGRVIQQALRPAVERMVGAPIRGSYTYASLYCGGTDLPVHTDRPQCKYSISLLIDHQPAPAGDVSPWAVQVYPDPAGPPVDCFQTLGGAILFRGHEIRHGRGPLPADQACWVMLLHYVDADFAGPLD